MDLMTFTAQHASYNLTVKRQRVNAREQKRKKWKKSFEIAQNNTKSRVSVCPFWLVTAHSPT